jgi:hypothetical protein
MRFSQALRGAILCAAVVLTPTIVYGWGFTVIHEALASQYYTNPEVLALANYFGTNVSDVTAGAGDLDSAGDPDHATYHGGQWDMTKYRQYAYDANYATNKWYDSGHSRATLIKYMLHNLGDNSVPIGHSPANEVSGAGSGQTKEAYFEAQGDFSSYGGPSDVTPSSWYSGTISQIVTTFHSDDIANTIYFRDNVSTGFLTVTPWANANAAAHEGWRIDQMLGRAVMTDYYLTQCSPLQAKPSGLSTWSGSVATPTGAVPQGANATFDASALRDPDNITWNSNGTYYYRSDWTGISQVQWDFNNDGTYDATGLQVAKNWWALRALFGGGSSGTCRVDVLDDEGLHWSTTANITLAAIPEPGSGLLAILATASALLFSRFRRRAR